MKTFKIQVVVRRVALKIAAASFLMVAVTLDANAQTWTGAGGDLNFSNPANWQGGVAPLNNGTANVTFTGTGAPVNTILDTNYSLRSVTTSGTSIVGFFGGLVGNQTLSLIEQFTAGANTVMTSMLDLVLGAPTVTVDVSSGRRMEVYSSISGGTLVKTGAGLLDLSVSQPNSFSGLTLNAGTVLVGSDAQLGTSSAPLTMGGSGILWIAGSSGVGLNRNVVLNPGTTGHVTVTTTGTSSLTGVISGAGNLTKSGPGVLAVTNPSNTYSGTTFVTSGTLLMDGTLLNSPVMVTGGTLAGSGTFFRPVTVSNGTLVGSGTFQDAVTLTSGARVALFTGRFSNLVTISSGARFTNAAVTEFANGLTLEAGATLEFVLGSAPNKFLVTGGTLTGPASGTITLNLLPGAGYSPGIFTLVDFTDAASVANFAASKFSIGAMLSGSTSANYSLVLSGTALQLFSTASTTAIPEPSTYAAMAGLGVLTFAAVRRRRSKASVR